MRADWPSENILLGLLCERPMHGYELARLAQEDQALRAIWRIERSEVYFLLGKLRQKGLIAEHAEEHAAGPARTIYAPARPRGFRTLASDTRSQAAPSPDRAPGTGMDGTPLRPARGRSSD